MYSYEYGIVRYKMKYDQQVREVVPYYLGTSTRTGANYQYKYCTRTTTTSTPCCHLGLKDCVADFFSFLKSKNVTFGNDWYVRTARA